MADCQLCGRPQRADTAYACQPCANSTERSLHTAAEHWPDLQDSVARLVRHGDPTPRAGKPAPAQPIRPGIGGADQALGWPSGLVVNLAASEVADAVVNTATTWARPIIGERYGGAGWPATDTPGLLSWLAGQVGWIRHQPFAAECLDELGDLGRLVVRAVDRPRPRVDAGECGAATQTGPCRRRLSASPGAAYVHCPACRATWSAADRSAVILAAAKDVLATAVEISTWLAIHGETAPVGTIYSWASRHRLLKRGVDLTTGQPRYRVGDVRELLAQRDGRRTRRVAA